MKTNELTGAALDWAVAKCEGWENLRRNPHRFADFLIMSKGGENLRLEDFNPSTDWSQGGPIIERERIILSPDDEGPELWCSWKYPPDESDYQYGPTPLIAAMRCYVASKLGDDVEIPEELK